MGRRFVTSGGLASHHTVAPVLTLLLRPPDAPAEVTEAELIARARGGDEDAFAALYQRWLPAVRRFLRDLLRDQLLADEAAQETFVRAFVRIEGLRDRERALPWLLGIARLVSLEARREARGPVTAVGLAVSGDGEVALSPEDLLASREAGRAVEAALCQLGEDRRAVLLLRADHGLSCAEIAELMGFSVAKVKVEVHRARLELRALVGRHKGGTP
jgi:RNA polymerase sigma-70 factor (ECF subfamily)